MRKIKKFAVLLSAMFFLYGCAAGLLAAGAGAGIGTYKYFEGRLSSAYPISYAKALEATQTALANLQISTSESMDEGTKGKIEGVRKDGKKVYIKLEELGAKVTNITVRVGMLGDQSAAERIHDEITAVSRR